MTLISAMKMIEFILVSSISKEYYSACLFSYFSFIFCRYLKKFKTFKIKKYHDKEKELIEKAKK